MWRTAPPGLTEEQVQATLQKPSKHYVLTTYCTNYKGQENFTKEESQNFNDEENLTEEEETEDEKQSFTTELLNFKSDLFMEIEDKFEVMEKNLKLEQQSFLENLAERVFTEMDHERFINHMDLQFASIKKSMDGIIRGALIGTAEHFIGETENNFKEDENADLDAFIDDVFMKDMARARLQ